MPSQSSTFKVAHVISEIRPRSIIGTITEYLNAGNDDGSQHPRSYTVITAIACVSAVAVCVAIGIAVTKVIARRRHPSNKSYFNLDSVSSNDSPDATWLSNTQSEHPPQAVAMEISGARDSPAALAAASGKGRGYLDNRNKSSNNNNNSASAVHGGKEQSLDVVKP